MFSRVRFLTAGESHGPKLTTILEGIPAGFPLSSKLVNEALKRRQKGFGRGGRMKIEQDEAHISSGVAKGITTGAPIALEVTNLDYAKWKNKKIAPMTVPRPGHADLTGALKYDHADLRLSLERASARETAARVCAGSVCEQILSAFGIEVQGYVTQVGKVKLPAENSSDKRTLRKRFVTALENEFALPDKKYVDQVREEIHACMKAKNTLGGIFEVVALGLPPGLGSYTHYDRRLDAQIAFVLMSIQAMKGVEFGPAFENAALRGTQVHDEITQDKKGALKRKTNRAGGLEGGVTTGMPLIARVAMKPISTTLSPLESVDLAKKKKSKTVYERSDFCAVSRAVVVGEAMVSFALLNSLLEKLGGDSLSEMKPRFKALKTNSLKSLKMHNKAWNFEYEKI